jgi:hypothetical protein|uniref:H0303A11-B0406H05.7 protein n=1 Tax=Oryza sativa TaxID=4530 RepID=Q01HJ9_ORYSA|nr:H0303A11-B0406H05.7 [Oryza sativa]
MRESTTSLSFKFLLTQKNTTMYRNKLIREPGLCPTRTSSRQNRLNQLRKAEHTRLNLSYEPARESWGRSAAGGDAEGVRRRRRGQRRRHEGEAPQHEEPHPAREGRVVEQLLQHPGHQHRVLLEQLRHYGHQDHREHCVTELSLDDESRVWGLE